jgi:hypothetical protein
MSITLGVYDVFTYAAPGSLYLAVLTYIATRLGWVDPLQMLHANATLTVIAAALASYLLGQVTYVLGLAFNFSVSPWNRDMADARSELLARVPAASGRPFLDAHQSVLQAAVEIHEISAAIETTRLRAVGLMLRNSAPPLILGAAVAIVVAATGHNPAFAACCAVVLLLAGAGCLFRAARVGNWADIKTLELAFWIPDIDNLLDPGGAKARTAPAEGVSRGQRRRSIRP